MKKHSKIYKAFTFLISIVISIIGVRTDVFAASTSIECGYGLCSRTIISSGPYKVGSTVSSSIPVYGGYSLSSIDSQFNNNAFHYTLLYCSEFGTGTLKKRHTFSVAASYHRYTIPTDDYIPVHAGDSLINRARTENGGLGNLYEYNPATGNYDILDEYIEPSDESVWHFRKYLCGRGFLSSVYNKSSGDVVSFADAKSATESMGCGEGAYVIDYHDSYVIYHGHNSESGAFFYSTENEMSKLVFVSELEYDNSRGGYILPGTDYCITQLPNDGDSYNVGFVGATDSAGSVRAFTYMPHRMICYAEKKCDLCGWSKTSRGAGYPETSVTSNDSSTHHILVKCSTCGEKYVDKNVEHNFKYGEYTPLILSNGKSTQHSVTRTCVAKAEIPSCGYSDTINEDHIWEYSSATSLDGTSHKTTRTCSKCGYSEEVTDNHSFVFGDWIDNSDTSHIRTVSCEGCGYETTESQTHNFTVSYEPYSSTHHKVIELCECGHSKMSYEEHIDNNHDNCCDKCGYYLSIFSVTVPTSMNITVDRNGKTYSASNAAITNNSTNSVEVVSISLSGKNGWSVVPYSTNMANEKVDAKKIGIKICNSLSTSNQSMQMFGNWTINQGNSLALPYSAVVSATSSPITDQNVIDITFVIDWSDA